MIGNPQSDDLPSLKIVRPGVVMRPNSTVTFGQKPSHMRNSSTSANLYRPKTLVLGDAFNQAARNQIVPFFADVTLLHNKSAATQIASAMVANETIVLEVAERVGATGNLPMLLSDRQLAIILKALASHPLK